MPLTQPKTLYGIHSVTFYQRDTYEPYGIMRVLGGSSITLAGEMVPLTGGSSKYQWDAQDGNITAEMVLKTKELPNFLFNVLLGKTPAQLLSDPGNTTTLENIKGTLVEATTGIASVGIDVGEEADLKFTQYMIKAVSATTVDIFAFSNVDFFSGTDVQYVDDTLKINAAPLTILGTSGVTDVPDHGIEIIGGSGAIALVTGDTAIFNVRPASKTLDTVRIGELGSCTAEFGAVVTAQKQADGTMYKFDVFRLKAIGFPFGMEEKAYNEAEITASVLYDSVKDGIMDITRLTPDVACS